MKLEVGKSYRNHRGEKVDIVGKSPETAPFEYRGVLGHIEFLWTKDGRLSFIHNEYDIVSEWKEKPTQMSAQGPIDRKQYTGFECPPKTEDTTELRDRVAIACISILIDKGHEPEEIGEYAYQIADAMLKARKGE